MRLYLAGPMAKIKHYNFPAFDDAAVKLEAVGHTVFNPAQNDRDNGFDAVALDLKGTEGVEFGFDLRLALKQDLSWICDNAEGLALLPNWQKSAGVAVEIALAHALQIPVLLVGDWLMMAYDKKAVLSV